MDRVLAFGCHPDDLEFMAGGTLALLGEKGYEIHLATMAGGEVGSPSVTRQQIRARRLAEADKSAQILGGTYHYAGGCDLEVEYNAHYRRLATRVMRKVDPLIVFTNPPMDYLIDHEETSRLVRNAAYIAPVPLYDCGLPTTPTKRFPYLYYWNAAGLRDIFGRPLPVHFGVDVTGMMEVKEKMLLCHESQREWLEFLNGPGAYMEAMKATTRRQGELVGKQFGECFIQHLGTGHPQDNILKEILGDLCVEISG